MTRHRKYTKPLNVRISPEQDERLTHWSNIYNRDKAELIRYLLDHASLSSFPWVLPSPKP